MAKGSKLGLNTLQMVGIFLILGASVMSLSNLNMTSGNFIFYQHIVYVSKDLVSTPSGYYAYTQTIKTETYPQTSLFTDKRPTLFVAETQSLAQERIMDSDWVKQNCMPYDGTSGHSKVYEDCECYIFRYYTAERIETNQTVEPSNVFYKFLYKIRDIANEAQNNQPQQPQPQPEEQFSIAETITLMTMFAGVSLLLVGTFRRKQI